MSTGASGEAAADLLAQDRQKRPHLGGLVASFLGGGRRHGRGQTDLAHDLRRRSDGSRVGGGGASGGGGGGGGGGNGEGRSPDTRRRGRGRRRRRRRRR